MCKRYIEPKTRYMQTSFKMLKLKHANESKLNWGKFILTKVKELLNPYNISNEVDISPSCVLWKCILDFNHSTKHKAGKVTIASIEFLNFLPVPPTRVFIKVYDMKSYFRCSLLQNIAIISVKIQH